MYLSLTLLIQRFIYDKSKLIVFIFSQNNKNNHVANNHDKNKKEKRDMDNGTAKKAKKEKTEKSTKVNNDKNPHTTGVKRKLEDGECDPEPTDSKRHER